MAENNRIFKCLGILSSFMAFSTILLGALAFSAGLYLLATFGKNGKIRPYGIMCTMAGLLFMVDGTLLSAGVIKTDKKYVLQYLVLSSAWFFVISICVIVKVLLYKLPIGYVIVTIVGLILAWLGQFGVFKFYKRIVAQSLEYISN